MNGPLRELEPRMSAESVSYAAPPQGAGVRDARRPPLRVLSGRGLRRDVEDRDACSQPDAADDVLAALRQLPATATLRDVVEAVIGERPNGHSQTYANVVLTQRALAQLAAALAGRDFEAWEPEH
jgi:hypothetical protein